MGDLYWWIAVIGVPLVGAIFAVDYYIHRNQQEECDKKDSEITALHDRINAVTAAFNDYRVNSAQLFATVTAMGEMKREMVSALTRIEDKLDRIGERNDRRDRN